MKDLLINIISGIVYDKQAVNVIVDEPNQDDVIIYHVKVAQQDMGRVIGKQGKVAKSIRNIMKAAAFNVNEKILISID